MINLPILLAEEPTQLPAPYDQVTAVFRPLSPDEWAEFHAQWKPDASPDVKALALVRQRLVRFDGLTIAGQPFDRTQDGHWRALGGAMALVMHAYVAICRRSELTPEQERDSGPELDSSPTAVSDGTPGSDAAGVASAPATI